jgi:hypothetical protein
MKWITKDEICDWVPADDQTYGDDEQIPTALWETLRHTLAAYNAACKDINEWLKHSVPNSSER